MKNLTIKNPYSDESLYWNSSTEQYELKSQFVLSNFANTYSDAGILDFRIKKNSRIIYQWIYSHCNSRNIPVVQKCLNQTEEGRKFIKQALLMQLSADLETGYNDIGQTPAINVSNGKNIGRKNIQENLITVETEQFLTDMNMLYFGFNLMFAGVFPYSMFLSFGVNV